MSFFNSIKNSVSDSFNWVSGDIAIDLGTANTLIWLSGKGIIINEPSIIARSTKTGAVLAVGDDAKEMLGKTHEGIETIRPLRDGVIADFTAVDEMLQGFIRKVNLNRLTRPRMVICVPSGVTEVERRAVRDSGEKQAAREVFLVDEPVAAAIGIGLDISKPVGNIIVDIGGGTTEVAVLSLGGTVVSESLRIAGDEINESIATYLKKKHNMVVGERTSEKIKIKIGSAFPDDSFDNTSFEVKGLHLSSGLPRSIALTAGEIREAMTDPLSKIIEAIKRTLERTPPDLAADIVERGIMLAGGGALIKGINDLVSQETGIFTHIAEDPLLCVVNGCGNVLDDFRRLKRCVDTVDLGTNSIRT